MTGPATLCRSGLRGQTNVTVVVGLGLLRSYAGVGTALASCGAGCTCDPERFDLIHKALVRPGSRSLLLPSTA